MTQPRVLVWDWPVRVFHWLVVACFAGAWLTAESEAWHLVHITLGYTLGGLVAFRLVWGVVGSRTARFTSFVRSPRAALAYLQHLKAVALGQAPREAGSDAPVGVGHNPAGAWAIVGLLVLIATTVGLGWATETERLPAFLDEAHEAAATALLALVGLHVAGVVVGSLVHRDNLVRAMLTGFGRGRPQDAIARSWWWLGALMLAAVLAFWGWQWQQAPANPHDPSQVASHDKDDDGDDD
ncbi:cytochrome b/b6 domain-containing protein [Ideonella margarita]|uniref:Cytochrome b/b6 domain-containing protein n=1 Tax=Ideonella margarita TaxID=2984191 RepID=A0ABU9C3X8_9BURK